MQNESEENDYVPTGSSFHEDRDTSGENDGNDNDDNEDENMNEVLMDSGNNMEEYDTYEVKLNFKYFIL